MIFLLKTMPVDLFYVELIKMWPARSSQSGRASRMKQTQLYVSGLSTTVNLTGTLNKRQNEQELSSGWAQAALLVRTHARFYLFVWNNRHVGQSWCFSWSAAQLRLFLRHRLKVAPCKCELVLLLMIIFFPPLMVNKWHAGFHARNLKPQRGRLWPLPMRCFSFCFTSCSPLALLGVDVPAASILGTASVHSHCLVFLIQHFMTLTAINLLFWHETRRLRFNGC